ncbi:hypothetical protein K474DRAFT_456664 [Panus rudis PR-1116 ss-1]|nr:hypothetical protein K474DRAFT_456664 [Panus rudis PR-1116 ss-1]
MSAATGSATATTTTATTTNTNSAGDREHRHPRRRKPKPNNAPKSAEAEEGGPRTSTTTATTTTTTSSTSTTATATASASANGAGPSSDRQQTQSQSSHRPTPTPTPTSNPNPNLNPNSNPRRRQPRPRPDDSSSHVPSDGGESVRGNSAADSVTLTQSQTRTQTKRRTEGSKRRRPNQRSLNDVLGGSGSTNPNPGATSQPQTQSQGQGQTLRTQGEKRHTPRDRKAKFNAELTEANNQGQDHTPSPSSSVQTEKAKASTHDKPKKPPKPKPNLPKGDDLTSSLIRDLSTPPYPDCPICFSAIRPAQPTWSCSPSIPVLGVGSGGDGGDERSGGGNGRDGGGGTGGTSTGGGNENAQYCWTTFHLKCIRSWASKSVKDVEEAWRARGESRKGEWRCPGCQARRGVVPTVYYCFCGTTPDPTPPRLSTPHSCANPCNRKRNCGHPCSESCHPGPCPPCQVTLRVGCFCGREVMAVRCAQLGLGLGVSRGANVNLHNSPRSTANSTANSTSDSNSKNPLQPHKPPTITLSCKNTCNKLLPCTIHTCQEVCHDGPCGDCQKRWIGRFDCAGVCGRPFDCGIHKCEKGCHPQDARPAKCPRSPEVVRTCPCGKYALPSPSSGGSNPASSSTDTTSNATATNSNATTTTASSSTTPSPSYPLPPTQTAFPPTPPLLRTHCTDPIPTCLSTCLKPLPTCGHLCQRRCHEGDCLSVGEGLSRKGESLSRKGEGEGLSREGEGECGNGRWRCEEVVRVRCRCGVKVREVKCWEITGAGKREREHGSREGNGEGRGGKDGGGDDKREGEGKEGAGKEGEMIKGEGGMEILCDKPCTALRNCGRHECKRVCCPLASLASVTKGKGKKKGNGAIGGGGGGDTVLLDTEAWRWHECDLVCGKLLSCGNHRCEEKDHKGACPPCLRSSFDEMICHCGRTILDPPIPCGTRLNCPYPCTRPAPPCGHPKLPHTCHEDPTPCPPCVHLTTKKCACGKKLVDNVRCSMSEEKVSCGMVCGRLMGCGWHHCERSCHPGECGDCHAVCGKSRKLWCVSLSLCLSLLIFYYVFNDLTLGCTLYSLPENHPCTLPCHAPSSCPETSPCLAPTTITCPCGRIRQQVACGRSTSNPAGRTGLASGSNSNGGGQQLKCSNECAVAKRNARLAEALGIHTAGAGSGEGNASGGAGGGGESKFGQVTYGDELVAYARANAKFCAMVEKSFAEFLASGKKSQILAHMPEARRNWQRSTEWTLNKSTKNRIGASNSSDESTRESLNRFYRLSSPLRQIPLHLLHLPPRPPLLPLISLRTPIPVQGIQRPSTRV